MWICPKCDRRFKTKNQYHVCTKKDIGELFLGKPDALVLAFDRIMSEVMQWEPNYVGPSTNAIVFTNSKAWLIIRPMTKELDVKFYYHEKIESTWIRRYSKYSWRFAHHMRVKNEEELDTEFFGLLRMGYDHAISNK